MMKLQMGVLFAAVALLLAGTASAQIPTVKVGPGGNVAVDTGGTTVRTGPGGTVVDTPGAKVSTDRRGSRVETPGAVVDTGAHAPAKGLKKRGPIVCKGDKDLVLSKFVIRTPGQGVHVKGNCTVVLNKCHIEAGKVGVVVEGNGDVVLNHCFVAGGRGALTVKGNGTLKVKGSTLKGRVRTQANGDLVKQGGNTFLK